MIRTEIRPYDRSKQKTMDGRLSGYKTKPLIPRRESLTQAIICSVETKKRRVTHVYYLNIEEDDDQEIDFILFQGF